MKTISVVLPCLNEAQNLPLLIPQIIKSIPKKYNYEIILVNDGSSDNTTTMIELLARKNKNIKGIIFYKRFGHQPALKAGIENATGSAVITMDSDFQHPPSLIPKLIKLWEKGYDLVSAQKTEDHSSGKLMRFGRKIGYFIWQKVSGGLLIPGVSDFRIMSREISLYLKENPEKEIFIRGLTQLVAKNPTSIKYKVGKRKFGKTSYTLSLATNLFINGFISFSTFPLRSAWVLGIIFFLIIGIYLIFDIVVTLL